MVSDKIKILIVDDSDIILKLLQEYFKQYNVKISACTNGLEGIKKTIEYKPDVILLDLMMPDFDGLKMLQVVKLLDELKGIPIIVISGNTDKTNVLSVIEAGADQILAKPLQKNLLIKAVENALGAPLPASINYVQHNDEESDPGLVLQLKKLFIQSYYKEKTLLENSIDKEDPIPLKNFAHNAKTVGKSIGYPQLHKINTELENLLSSTSIDWQIIQIKFRKLLLIIRDIENSLLVWEN